jgi:phage-related holin
MIFQMATAFYYFANEGISILENAALLGVPFPAKVKGALEELRDKGADKAENDGGE